MKVSPLHSLYRSMRLGDALEAWASLKTRDFRGVLEGLFRVAC
jgi:hypothetical protein